MRLKYNYVKKQEITHRVVFNWVPCCERSSFCQELMTERYYKQTSWFIINPSLAINF